MIRYFLPARMAVILMWLAVAFFANPAPAIDVPSGLAIKAITVAHPGSLRAGTIFRECPHCPKMVVLPPGSFLMGATPDITNIWVDASPPPKQKPVSIPVAFAVGMFNVTKAEYEAFAKETNRLQTHGCDVFDPVRRWVPDSKASWRNPGFFQTGLDPVVCVSWYDAQDYVAWLNQKVKSRYGMNRSARPGPYRLLTEAEWEYAARSGSNTRYYWGSQPNHNLANYGLEECLPCGGMKQGRDSWLYTSPGGAFPPNKFGLYDMIGNVWEWTDGCRTDPTMGRGLPGQAKNCHDRILRGGSWLDMSAIVEIKEINPWPMNTYNYANGFRVARSLE